MDSIKEFIQEADEKAWKLRYLFGRLSETMGGNATGKIEVLNEMLKEAHTLKGIASLGGFPKLTQAAHWLETILEVKLKGASDDSDLDSEFLDVVNEFLNVITNLLESIKMDGREKGKLDIAISKATSYITKNRSRVFSQVFGSEGEKLRTYRLTVNLDNVPDKIPAWTFSIVGTLQTAGRIISSEPTLNSVLKGEVKTTRISFTVESPLEVNKILDTLKKLPGVRDVKIEEATEILKNLMSIQITLREDSPLKAARSLLILRDLEQVGKIKEVKPPVERIREGELLNGRAIEVVIETHLTPKDIQSVILRHYEVERVEFKEPKANETPRNKAEKSKKPARELQSDERILEISVSQRKLEEMLFLLESLRLPGFGDDKESKFENMTKECLAIVRKLRDILVGILTVDLLEKVRELAEPTERLGRNLGKELQVVVEGEAVRVDRKTATVIWEALVHLLRNAAIHGIEQPEERRELGKPERGTVKVILNPGAGYVELRVWNDGKEINATELKKRAVERGILTPEEAKKLSNKEAINLIFESGISTKEEASPEAGRGLGLSIVRELVESRGGSVYVESEPRKGTAFIMKVPAEVSMLKLYLLKVDGRKFAVPATGTVDEIRTRTKGSPRIGKLSLVQVSGEVVPAIRLHDFVEMGAIPGKELEGPVFLLDNGKKVAVLSDGILERRECTLKSLHDIVPSKTNEETIITAVAVLGKELVPVVDLSKLLEAAGL